MLADADASGMRTSDFKILNVEIKKACFDFPLVGVVDIHAPDSVYLLY
jgi:hypothetical protein